MSLASASPREDRPFARRLRAATVAAIVLGAFAYATLVALSRVDWLADVAASFRPFAALGLLGATAVLVLLRARIAAAFVAACALYLAIPWLGLALSSRREGAAGDEIRLATVNLYMHNPEIDAFRAWLARESPDVLALQELPALWRDPLDDLAGVYPTGLVYPERSDPNSRAWFAIGLFTRLPVVSKRVVEFGGKRMPLLELVVDRGGERWTIRAIHATAPYSREAWRMRNEFLRFLASELVWDERTVLVGDFNTSSGSGAWTDLAEGTRLDDSRAGFGWQPSWKTDQKIRGIPTDLDHVLVGDAVRVLERRLFDCAGSDHRGVIVRLDGAR